MLRTAVVARVKGDHVAVVGENRKMLVFPPGDLPKCQGQGCAPQRYKEGGLSDAITFTLAEGLSWKDPAGADPYGNRSSALARRPGNGRGDGAPRLPARQPASPEPAF